MAAKNEREGFGVAGPINTVDPAGGETPVSAQAGEIEQMVKSAKAYNKGKPVNKRIKWLYKCQLHTAGKWVYLRYTKIPPCACSNYHLLSLREAEEA